MERRRRRVYMTGPASYVCEGEWFED